MSEEKPEPTLLPAQISISGEEFLSPTLLPEREKRPHYYVLSPLLPLAALDKNSRAIIYGNTIFKAIISRIFSNDSEEKMKSIELISAVVGQASRALGRGTEYALLGVQKEGKKPSLLDKLLGRR